MLRDAMPVAGRLGVEVADYRDGILSLRAPLALNLNDKGTAFAGSLAMVATLTGWSLMWLLLRQHHVSGDIVLQDSSVKYLRPVVEDFTASTTMPSPSELQPMLDALARKGKGRLKLEVTVADRAGLIVKFTGRYVVSRK
ncbi:MAG TPA: YiiD C-terminal domain-containing protein [Gemmatimonadales bacterium]|nr:YiiD C-terminal domain-containing protein [Gemmatimonadales bacterium]